MPSLSEVGQVSDAFVAKQYQWARESPPSASPLQNGRTDDFIIGPMQPLIV
jgi:hypothetical protein